tara:strand:- start:1495 stop:2694 length:1200 start_codon:yes stop_codon:yes gene_type:complete
LVLFRNKEISKINVCLITEEFRPSIKGGIATWSSDLAYYLHKQNYNVTVFIKKHKGIKKSFDINKFPFKVYLMRGRDWAFFKKWYISFYIFKFLKRNQKPIIISTNWELSQGIIFYKNFFKFSLITILHGLEVTRLKSFKYKHRVKNFTKAIINSDKTVSVSNYTKNKANTIIKNKIDIEVIPNFVNTKNFYPISDEKYFTNFSHYKNDIILLTLSRLVKRKGHLVVIDSMKELTKKYSNIRYLIAGTGDKSYEKELKKYIKKLNLEKYIHLLGYISEKRKKIIYNLCDIYIMTSLPNDEEGDSEGFGITFLEANACGKPVIGSKVGGISDVIYNGKNGFLVEPSNSRNLTNTLIKIIDDKNLYNILSKNSVNFIEENFDISLIGKRFKKIINKLYHSL